MDRRMNARASLLLLAVLAAGCRSRSVPPADDPAPRAATSVTSASTLAPSSADKGGPLLVDDPSWTRTERMARVVSVTSCGKKDDQLCERLAITNEGTTAIAELLEV